MRKQAGKQRADNQLQIGKAKYINGQVQRVSLTRKNNKILYQKMQKPMQV